MDMISKILIVGGGTAGWLTAGILAKIVGSNSQSPIEITLVESPDIPTIGVGEGSFPTLVETLALIGIPEQDFMTYCGASFKQAIHFRGWRKSNKNQSLHDYFHLFDEPLRAPGYDLASCWSGLKKPRMPFADAVCPQSTLCRNDLAPKPKLNTDSLSNTRYAYHLDAGKLGELLRDFCTKNLGIRLVSATVTSVNLTDDGNIESVDTKQEGEIRADFFVDCTGFRSVLLGSALQIPFIDKSDSLFVDSAIAIQVPNPNSSCTIPSNTRSTAHEAGWSWDIALAHRRGVGYVYSSQYTDRESAEKTIRNYIGPQSKNLDAKHLSFKVGVREQQWKNNCLAIGFSGGFAEPLEATAIAMIESAALTLASDFPYDLAAMPVIRQKFNDTFEFRWQSIFDFIKMHYYLNDREEPFWVENRNPDTISDRLALLLDRWRYYPPNSDDFPSAHGMFSVLSWQYVLYGMDYETNVDNHLRIQRQMPHIEKGFQRVRQLADSWKVGYPTNRQLLDSINSQ